MSQGQPDNNSQPNLHERDGQSIAEFCTSIGISRSLFYKLRKRGIGPRVLSIGSRRIITRTAKADFLKEQG
jgi:ACT domain-containing protein